MYYVYIIECEDKKFYTGMTDNVERRYKEHQRKGSHFTSYNNPTKVLYKESFPDKNQAARREKQIKGWTRAKKAALIEGDIALLKQLSRTRTKLS